MLLCSRTCSYIHWLTLSGPAPPFQGIFKSGDPVKRARAIVQAVTHYDDPKVLAEVSENLGEAMVGINCDELVSGNKKHLALAETPE